MPSGESDLRYLEAAARSIGAAMDGARFRVVVNKSTVPVAAETWWTRWCAKAYRNRIPSVAGDVRFGVASNPEFLREGTAIRIRSIRTGLWWVRRRLPLTIFCAICTGLW